MEQLAHRGDEGELGWLSASDQAVIDWLEPGVAVDRAHDRHPQRPAQTGVAHGCAGSAAAAVLTGLLEARHDADAMLIVGGSLPAGVSRPAVWCIGAIGGRPPYLIPATFPFEQSVAAFKCGAEVPPGDVKPQIKL